MQLRNALSDKWREYLLTGYLAISACYPAHANAGPQNGFGVYGGLIGASENGVTSNGISIGADAQFTINDNWSLNPYLMASAERSSASTSVSDELVGLQVRRWLGEWFVGGHAFVHDRLVYGSGTTQSSAYGPALGLLAGVEYASGWGAEIQTDSFESTNTAGIRRNAVRVHLTYRWY